MRPSTEAVEGTDSAGLRTAVHREQRTAVSITDQEIVEGKVSVYDPDPGTNYVAGEDYAIGYQAGEITTLSSGDMTDGAEYAIDFEERPVGSFETGDYDPSTDRELVQEIASASSNRECEQAALFLVDELRSPRTSATVTLDRLAADTSLVKALAIADLPGEESLVVDSIEEGPAQVQLELGSRERLQTALQQARDRLSATERKV